MAALLFPSDFFHDYLRLQFPGKFIVCLHDSDDATKRTNLLTTLSRLFPTVDAGNWQFQLLDAGYALLVCDTQDEAWDLFRAFDNELDYPYATLFGPCASHPNGTVITENT